MYLSFGSDWFRRRWLDFRNGHSIYLIFVLTFANFITIQYKLLIDQIPYLAGVFNNIIFFAIVFVLMYVPIGIVLGYWHRKTQWKVEQDALFRENKVGAIMWMYVIDLIEGNVSEEDKKLMKEALLGITRGETRLYRTYKSSKNDAKIEDSHDK
jgi:predicted permease